MSGNSPNLLRLAAAHRAELSALRDPDALFALGFVDHVGSVSRAELQSDLGLDAQTCQAIIDKLNRAGWLQAQGAVLAVTPLGQRVLGEIGLRAPPAPTSLPEHGEPPPKPPRLPPTGGGGKLFWLLGALVLTILIVGAVIVAAPPGPGIITPTLEPTATRTAAPFPTDTSTPFIATSVQFEAKPQQLAAGQCSVLFWLVGGARDVSLEGKPVEPRGEQQVCPTGTTTYELAVVSDAGESTLHQVTIVVNRTATWFWTIQDQKDVFSDSRAQQALAYAIDEAVITGKVFPKGEAEFRSSDPKLKELGFDPGRSRKLLDAAGYRGQTVVIGFHDDPASRKIVDFVIKYLSGIDLPVKPLNDPNQLPTIFVGPSS